MSGADRKEMHKAFKRQHDKITRSKSAARKFLIGIGVITLKGNLRKPYRFLAMTNLLKKQSNGSR